MTAAQSTFRGLIAAPHTPMTDDEDLRLETMEKQVDWFVSNGLEGLFVCGTTGEGLSLTTDERLVVARRWVEVADGRLKIIVHVGHNSLRDACALAEDAQRCGADAVGSLPPTYFRPSTVDELLDFLEPIAKAAGDLPFYYYHIPSLSLVNLPMVSILERGADRIPNLRGGKFTHHDLVDFHRSLTLQDGRFEVLFGMDEILLSALAVGATGAVGSTYNYAAPAYQRMIDAYHHGEWKTARSIAERVLALVQVLGEFGGVAAGKAIMGLVGVDCGPTRAPVRAVTGERLVLLRKRLEEVGFFQLLEKSRKPKP